MALTSLGSELWWSLPSRSTYLVQLEFFIIFTPLSIKALFQVLDSTFHKSTKRISFSSQEWYPELSDSSKELETLTNTFETAAWWTMVWRQQGTQDCSGQQVKLPRENNPRALNKVVVQHYIKCLEINSDFVNKWSRSVGNKTLK